ncbi:aldo/keto reductase [Methanobrevibacter sp. YE315]|uniref:aldo/keto reductase n=1 Tax=Methanobrevibacter sp. YE315 TaxID=1609968 RepID=UPI000764EA19|nr:aldo/keto reductase [Methanobrevibacter sp. YE315]AMD17246.1 aldo/keto reductase [Methanobrevibacter sp. YE315]
MQNRLIKKTGEEISPLGFGAMRLPLKNGKIDRDKAKELIYYAIDNGVNFIDTAYLYGDSESFLGEILTDEIKSKVKICTKLPTINVRKYDDMENIFEEQLKRLRLDCIDYYLIHAVDLKAINRLFKRDLIKFIDKIKSEGKIKYVGFSYHGPKDEFEAIIDSYDWDVVMVQYNYFDENVQASMEGIEYAASKGMGVFVMEPLKGGILAGKMPKEAEEIFKKANPNKSNAQWAFEWVLNNRNVTCVLSGMNSFEQLNENLAIAEKTTPLSMSFEDMETVELVKRVMRNSLKINCSTCGYCVPCPQGVNIPECMKIYNEKYLFNHKGLINQSLIDYYQYVGGIMGNEGSAGLCNGCGKCLRKCPQKLDIVSELKKVKKEFEFPGVKYILSFVRHVGFPLYRQAIRILNR